MDNILEIAVVLILVLVVIGVVGWMYNKATIPEPFSYVVYGFAAILSLALLVYLVRLLGLAPGLFGHPALH